MNSGSESSDSDVSDEELNMQMMQFRGPRRKPARILNYIERTIPRLHRVHFREHFRLTSATYERLEQRLAPTLQGDVGV